MGSSVKATVCVGGGWYRNGGTEQRGERVHGHGEQCGDAKGWGQV